MSQDQEFIDTEVIGLSYESQYNNDIIESDNFNNDGSQNYDDFLKINKHMKPVTSTQLPINEKKFVYHPYKNNKEKACCPPKQIPLKTIHIPVNLNNKEKACCPPKQIPLKTIHIPVNCSVDQNQNLNQTGDFGKQNNYLLIELLKEVKYMRREIQELKQKINTGYTATKNKKLNLNIPRSTITSFNELEEEVKSADVEQSLINSMQAINDVSLDKYIRNCLQSVMTNEVACGFTWCGQQENIKIQQFTLIKIIKECAMEKFPNTRGTDVKLVMSKFFQAAKDKRRKNNEKKNFAV